jgi:uncharacterized repeat protein (TIGR03843 family)
MVDSVAEAALAARLRSAELDVVGRFASASNATLLVRLRDDEGRWPELPTEPDGSLRLETLAPDGFAVYKPQLGEAPLWDFPDGTLYRREVAAYEVSRRLGWDLVPATVERGDAPHGVGALQRYVPHDPEEHYFALVEAGDPAILPQLRRMVLFDLVIDNADRKGGHVLVEDGCVRLVDHGVSFHVDTKLRTVAWDFAGARVPERDRDDVARLAAGVADAPGALAELLGAEELDRLVERAREAARLASFPPPRGPRPFPWPLL